MSSPIRRLPDSELAVMQAVWECEPPAIRTDIERVLFQTQKIASTTLLTVLSRLRDKGFLAIEKDGRAHRYRPLISRQEYLAAQSRSFFQESLRRKHPDLRHRPV